MPNSENGDNSNTKMDFQAYGSKILLM